MALLSSPIQYPPSSSPPEQEETRKRHHGYDDAGPKPKKRLFGRSLWESTKPLEPINGNITRNTDAPCQNDTLNTSVLSIDGSESTTKEAVPHNAASPKTSAPFWVEPPCVESETAEQIASMDSSLTTVRTSNGRRFVLRERAIKPSPSYEQTIAQRSHTEAGKATKSFYGVDVHRLIEEANDINNKSTREEADLQIEHTREVTIQGGKMKKKDRMMWAEKYRAKKFTDLVGDERTHRSVLRWLKRWDATVFPGASKPMIKGMLREEDEKVHRKILLLTGPPGLGKTTLAHVCAKQAGYEVVEINASDERNRDVVKGRIRDCVGTENVRGSNSKDGNKTVRKAGRPICVVVDEVDGVVGGSGGSGDGGFMKALIDLVTLDQKNSNRAHTSNGTKEKRGDSFRLLRPMILICNDVYHPSLRPLRSSNLAEIVHVRKPPLDKVVARLKHVFETENVPADTDGVRRLCEATWGISSRRDDRGCSNTGEGDMRAVLVVGEWAAGKLRASAKISSSSLRLTRQWLEKHMLSDLTSTSGNGASSRGLGRGGTREAADRVFLDNAGFPKAATAPTKTTSTSTSISGPASATEATRTRALELLRDVVDTAGDTDRIVADIFTAYPSRAFHDDTLLSKPNVAADWLSFHDCLSSRIHGASQTYELAPYLSTSILACHTLFASAKTSLVQNSTSYNETEDVDTGTDNNPFQGPRADFIAYEQQKQTRAILSGLQSSLSIPLARSFRSPEHLSTDLVPFLHKMLSPAVTPVLVGGSGGNKTASVRKDAEKDMVNRAVKAMGASGVGLERMRVEDERLGNGGWIYRMEPPVDTLATFETAQKSPESALPARFAVRQILAQEHIKWIAEEQSRARQARFEAGSEQSARNGMTKDITSDKKDKASTDRKKVVVKKDFFGRVIKVEEIVSGEDGQVSNSESQGVGKAQTWVSYHEGFSNAVRKPIGLMEIIAGL